MRLGGSGLAEWQVVVGGRTGGEVGWCSGGGGWVGGRFCMSGWVKYVGEVVRVGGVVCLGRLGMLAWAVLCAGAGEWAVLYVWVGEGGLAWWQEWVVFCVWVGIW